MEPRDARALGELVDLLDGVGVRYSIGGSVAASYFGEPRSTMDIDMLVELSPESVPALLAALAPAFHADETSIHEAASRHSAFQLLHLGTYTKFDMFVSARSELDVAEMATRTRNRSVMGRIAR